MDRFEKLVPIGHPNRPGTKLESLKAIVVHYTANDAPTANDTANAKYFGRLWKGTLQTPFEGDGVTPFRYGSAHVIIDEDSATLAIPTDEVAWACGDRNKPPYTETFRGQQPLARNVFWFRQNYRSISVEICNNHDWHKAATNAKVWIIRFLKEKGLKLCSFDKDIQTLNIGDIRSGEVLICRHFDISGKICPTPYVDDPSAWNAFIQEIHEGLA